MVPFRADHIGSLLRPKRLREAFRSGRDLKAAQDEAVRDVVRLQQDCGLQVITDGEFRRVSYWEKFVRLTRGLDCRAQGLALALDPLRGVVGDGTAEARGERVGRARTRVERNDLLEPTDPPTGVE